MLTLLQLKSLLGKHGHLAWLTTELSEITNDIDFYDFVDQLDNMWGITLNDSQIQCLHRCVLVKKSWKIGLRI